MRSAELTRQTSKNQHPVSVTRAKQTIYLKVLSESGSHALACKTADCASSSACTWASKSEEFGKRLAAARLAGEKVLLLRYESNLDEVLLPETPMNIDDFARTQNSRFFRMKRLDPAYRDNAPNQVNISGPVLIQFGIDVVPQPVDVTPKTTK